MIFKFFIYPEKNNVPFFVSKHKLGEEKLFFFFCYNKKYKTLQLKLFTSY